MTPTPARVNKSQQLWHGMLHNDCNHVQTLSFIKEVNTIKMTFICFVLSVWSYPDGRARAQQPFPLCALAGLELAAQKKDIIERRSNGICCSIYFLVCFWQLPPILIAGVQHSGGVQ